MPIIKLELITRSEAEKVSAEVVQTLADALGSVLKSPAGQTWLRFSHTSIDYYAENAATQQPLDASIQPTFVEILQFTQPNGQQLVDEAEQVAATVARVLGRPKQNVHIIYAPDGQGRVAFGGKLAGASAG